MRIDRSLLVGFGCIILFSFCLRGMLIIEKHIIKHDDAVAYIMASGHTGTYTTIFNQQSSPLGEWVSASTWKGFLEFEDGASFQIISYDMAHYDFHPPLYFWVLHLWIKLFGTAYWTGLILNLLIDFVAATILFGFTSRLLKNGTAGLLASTIWILSPISMQTSTWVRHYSLFSLFGLLFVFLAYWITYRARQSRYLWVAILLLVLVGTLGMLTHYYFVFFIATVVVLVAYNVIFVNRQIKALLLLFAMLLTCIVLVIASFPDVVSFFLHSFTSYATAVQFGSALDFRLSRTLFIAALLFSPLALSGLIRILDKLFFNSLERVNISFDWTLFNWMFATAMVLWLITVGLYLVGFSPQHAMAAKYVSIAAPFVALSAVLLCQNVVSTNRRLLLVMLAGVLLLSVVSVAPSIREYAVNRLDVTWLQNADVVILDNVQHGSWPSVMLHANNDSEVYVAKQKYLLEHSHEWVDKFCYSNAVYVSFLRGKDTSKKGTRDIVALINNQCGISLVSETNKPLGLIQIYAQP